MRLRAAIAAAVVLAASGAAAAQSSALDARLDKLEAALAGRGNLAGVDEALRSLCFWNKRPDFHYRPDGSRRFADVVAKAAAAYARAGRHELAWRTQLCALTAFAPTNTNCHAPPMRGRIRAAIAATAPIIRRFLDADRGDQAALRRLLGHRAGVVRHYAGARAELEAERDCVKQLLRGKKLEACMVDRSRYSRIYLAVGGCTGVGAGRATGSVSSSRLPLGIDDADVNARTADALARIGATHSVRWVDNAPLEITGRWLRGLETLRRGDPAGAAALMPAADVTAHKSSAWMSQLLLIRSRMRRDRGEHGLALDDTTAATAWESWIRELRAIEHAANLRAAGRYVESEELLERKRGNRRFGCGEIKVAGKPRPDPDAPARHRRQVELTRAVDAVATAASRCTRADLRPLQRLVAADQPDAAKALRALTPAMGSRQPPLQTCDRALDAIGHINGAGESGISALNNDLGASVYGQGRFADAGKLFALASCLGTPGQRLRALSNQAAAALSAGDPVAAARLLERARLLEYAAPPRALVSLELNSGMVELGRGYTKDALEHFKKAQAHLAGITDVELRAEVIDRIGMAHDLAGRRDVAARHYKQALALREALGADHPAVAESLSNLATLAWARGETAEAHRLFGRMLALEERSLSRQLAYGSERDKRAAVARLDGTVDWLVSFHLGADPSASREAFAAILGRQGRALDAAARDHETLLSRAPAELRAALDELRALGERIVWLTLEGRPVAELRGLERRAESLEGKLAAAVPAIARDRRDTTDVFHHILAQLRPGQALITYVKYRRFDPRAGIDRYSKPRYAAYVVRASGPIQGVDLGEAAAIDRLIAGWRAALAERDPDQSALAARLGAALFAPLEARGGSLGVARDLFIAPDAQLNLIPFDALITGDQTLHQRFRITYLTSPRDLAAAPRPANAGDIVIFANPDFGPVDQAARRGGMLGEMPFAPLPGTAREADEIAAILANAKVRAGAEATGQAFKQLSKPSILHVATHGFFLPAAGPGDSDAEPIVTDAAPPPDRSAAPALVRSGLAFAGINRSAHDTVVTALELARLDLTGTRLVTLSACETGGGEAVSGDGVYGMRRALYLAGAETQLVSLWQVDDAATARLMIRFYRELSAGRSRAAALRLAKEELRRDPATAHPYFWAAFILAGSPDKLDGSSAGPVVDLSPDPEVPEVKPPPPVRGRRGCGCESSGTGSGLLWLLALALITRGAARSSGRAG